MKKQWIMWVAVVVVVIVIAVIGVVAISGKNGGTTATEINMKKMFDTIYADLKDQLPDSLTTQEINVKDGEQVAEYTGLVSTENVEKLLVSEPMISSQAYSAIALKVKAGADIEGIKQEMLDNLNMNKWICVSAEKLYITSYNNIIFAVMSDENWAKPVYDGFKKYVNNKNGKELEKTAEEDIELPDEMLIVE